MKTDYGKDLTDTKLQLCHSGGVCPRCNAGATDLRGTSASQATLEAQGKCFWNGERSHGFVCNKGARDRKQKPWT